MAKPYGYIYKITNKINNRVYIGQTTQKNPFERINFHYKTYKKEKFVLHAAIKKYGKDSFLNELLFAAFDAPSLDYFEIYFINSFNSLVPNGYNVSGGGAYGSNKMTPIIKQKISLGNKEYYKHNKSASLGMKRSLETKQLQSRIRKGFTSEARRWAAKNRNYGYIIKAIKISTNEEFDFKSMGAAARVLNLDSTCISRTLRNCENRKQHKGYRFELTKK